MSAFQLVQGRLGKVIPVRNFTKPGDPQPFHLRVRPAIVEIVGEQWLQRLDQHNRDEAGDAGAEDDDAAA